MLDDNKLRHSCGTLLVRNGVPIKDIQIWLGHSNFQTTLRYAHADIEDKRISANVINDKGVYNMKKTIGKSDVLQIIGNNIKTLRLSKGMTQEQMAEKLDHSVNFVSLIELRKSGMSVIYVIF